MSQVILITGATSGLGRHAALHLAQEGHHVIATGRNALALQTLREEGHGLELDVLRLDVTDADAIADTVRRVDELTNGHGVDVLINNAGYGLAGAVTDLSDADLRAQFDTNVFGLHAVTRAFVGKMQARGSGRILNVSSIGGQVTFPLFGAYHASKYAVEALSDAMRRELAPFGIHVVLIEPGAIHTGFADTAFDVFQKYADADTPFQQVYTQADEVRRVTDGASATPIVVSRAISRAVSARRPSARYMVPFSGRMAVALLRWVPTPIVDWAMRQALRLRADQVQRPQALAA